MQSRNSSHFMLNFQTDTPKKVRVRPEWIVIIIKKTNDLATSMDDNRVEAFIIQRLLPSGLAPGDMF